MVLVTPDGHIKNVELRTSPVSLGRAPDNTLAFPEDPGLSRHHLLLEERGGKWSVRDLGSKNGTFANGRRITQAEELEPGTRVAASHVVMTYQEPSDRSNRVLFDTPAPMKTELTYLGEVLSSKEGLREEAPFSWVFLRAGRELSQHRPLPELFGLILDLCLEAVPAARGVLLTLDESGLLVVQASRGDAVRISTTVRDKVLSEKASVVVHDVSLDQPILESSAIRQQGVCSLVAAPLQSDERVVGMVYLDSCDPQRRFERDDMNILTALANIAGIRIELEEWELRKRQLIAENVANLGRLTAALSHELNNPLGALKSGLDTLWRTTERGESLSDSERKKLEALQASLRTTLDESLDRMQQVIQRIQRFSNLDRAETRSVDLAELLADVVALAQTPPGPVEILLASEELPRVTCHPQALSTAIASLLAYALESCRREGVPGLGLSARAVEGGVEIRIGYEGSGLTREILAQLFEPSFEISRKRVEARNWSLFSARQVVRDQGGDVRAFSEPGEETGFVIELPVESS